MDMKPSQAEARGYLYCDVTDIETTGLVPQPLEVFKDGRIELLDSFS